MINDKVRESDSPQLQSANRRAAANLAAILETNLVIVYCSKFLFKLGREFNEVTYMYIL